MWWRALLLAVMLRGLLVAVVVAMVGRLLVAIMVTVVRRLLLVTTAVVGRGLVPWWRRGLVHVRRGLAPLLVRFGGLELPGFCRWYAQGQDKGHQRQGCCSQQERLHGRHGDEMRNQLLLSLLAVFRVLEQSRATPRMLATVSDYVACRKVNQEKTSVHWLTNRSERDMGVFGYCVISLYSTNALA